MRKCALVCVGWRKGGGRKETYICQLRQGCKHVSACDKTTCLHVKSLRLCSYTCVCPGRGSPPLSKADGLCGSQPTELVSSSSDIPSCHDDTRSQPIFAKNSVLL